MQRPIFYGGREIEFLHSMLQLVRLLTHLKLYISAFVYSYSYIYAYSYLYV